MISLASVIIVDIGVELRKKKIHLKSRGKMMTRHLGYFIQHTIKPLVDDLNKALKGCEKIKMDKRFLEIFIYELVHLEIRKLLVRSIVHIILGILFCMTVYFILV